MSPRGSERSPRIIFNEDCHTWSICSNLNQQKLFRDLRLFYRGWHFWWQTAQLKAVTLITELVNQSYSLTVYTPPWVEERATMWFVYKCICYSCAVVGVVVLLPGRKQYRPLWPQGADRRCQKKNGDLYWNKNGIIKVRCYLFTVHWSR